MKLLLSLCALSTVAYVYVNVNSYANKSDEKITAEALAVDSYRVIKVNGKIIYTRNGKDMSQGDVFQSNEKITFKTQQSRAAVISKVNGRKILSPKGSETTQATLLPPMNNISPRAGGLNNIIDLQNHFDGKYLVLGVSKLKVSPKSFPMDSTKNQFFYLKYSYEGEVIPKKLSYEDDKLVLDANEIYKIDGEAIDGSIVSNVELFYLNDKTSTAIGGFELIFGDTESLKTELEIILAEIGKEDREKAKEDITSYLNEYYGKPDQANLSAWVDEHLF